MAKTKTPTVPQTPVLTDADERLVGTRELLERFLPVHRATLNAMISEQRFPKPIKLGKQKLFWRWSAILKWLADREKNPVARREFRNYLKVKNRGKRSADSARA